MDMTDPSSVGGHSRVHTVDSIEILKRASSASSEESGGVGPPVAIGKPISSPRPDR